MGSFSDDTCIEKNHKNNKNKKETRKLYQKDLSEKDAATK